MRCHVFKLEQVNSIQILVSKHKKRKEKKKNIHDRITLYSKDKGYITQYNNHQSD